MVKKTDKGKNSRKGQMKEGTPDSPFGEENSFLQILELAPDAFFRGDTQGDFLYVNQSAISLTGYSGEELLKLGMHDLFPEEVLVEKPLRFDLLREGRALKTERSLRTKSGKLVPVEMHSRMMPDGTFQSFMRDISERKRAEEALRASEEKYRNLFEKSEDAILIIENRTFVDCNEATVRMLRYKNKKELLNTHPSELSPEVQSDGRLSYEKADEMMRIALKQGSHRFEWNHKRADGEVFPVEVLLTAISVDDNKQILHTVWRDITDRKQAEEKLQCAKEYAENLVHTANVIFAQLNNKGEVVKLNEAAEQVTGYTQAEIQGKSWFETLVPKDRYPQVWEMFSHITKSGHVPRIFENPILTKNGQERHIVWQNSVLKENDDIVGTISFGMDITDRKQTELALRKSEEKFRTLIDQATDAMFLSDLNGHIIDLNRRACQSLGYTREALLEKNVRDLDPEFEEMDHVNTIWEKLLPGKTVTVESTHRRKDGSIFPVEINTGKIEIDGKPAILGVVRDLTDRKQAELALRKSEEKFRTLIDQGSDAMLLSDLNGNIVEVNQQACQNLGYTREELLEKNVRDLDPEFEEMDHVNTIWEKLLPGKTVTVESTHRRKDGSTFPVEINTGKIEIDGKPVIFGVVRDLTERKQAEEKLYQAQKMDSIGNLAGGVAHDFNNMLGGIMGYASLLLMKESDPQKKNSIEAIIRAAERASELTQKLLAFGRKGKHLVQPVVLNETIHEVHGLLKRSVDKRIEFVENLDGKLFTVDGDPSQMHQVIMNLCVNASHAMAEGGILTTSTRNVTLDATTGHKWPDLAPGDYVEVEVTDTGCGMGEEVRRRAFDPFFSTKEDGVVKGTGLGLATVYGIVKNHGGP